MVHLSSVLSFAVGFLAITPALAVDCNNHKPKIMEKYLNNQRSIMLSLRERACDIKECGSKTFCVLQTSPTLWGVARLELSDPSGAYSHCNVRFYSVIHSPHVSLLTCYIASL